MTPFIKSSALRSRYCIGSKITFVPSLLSPVPG